MGPTRFYSQYFSVFIVKFKKLEFSASLSYKVKKYQYHLSVRLKFKNGFSTKCTGSRPTTV